MHSDTELLLRLLLIVRGEGPTDDAAAGARVAEEAIEVAAGAACATAGDSCGNALREIYKTSV